VKTKKSIENIWGWLNEITLYKSSPDKFTDSEWDKWNTYMINRFLSMNQDYIEIVNYVQKINPQKKKQIYSIYRELIPKKKVYLKYIKNRNEKLDQESIESIKMLKDYYQCSFKEAEEYYNILK